MNSFDSFSAADDEAWFECLTSFLQGLSNDAAVEVNDISQCAALSGNFLVTTGFTSHLCTCDGTGEANSLAKAAAKSVSECLERLTLLRIHPNIGSGRCLSATGIGFSVEEAIASAQNEICERIGAFVVSDLLFERANREQSQSISRSSQVWVKQKTAIGDAATLILTTENGLYFAASEISSDGQDRHFSGIGFSCSCNKVAAIEKSIEEGIRQVKIFEASQPTDCIPAPKKGLNYRQLSHIVLAIIIESKPSLTVVEYKDFFVAVWVYDMLAHKTDLGLCSPSYLVNWARVLSQFEELTTGGYHETFSNQEDNLHQLILSRHVLNVQKLALIPRKISHRSIF